MEFEVVDAHVHCGKGYTLEDYLGEIKETSIKSAVIFPQAHDVYPMADKNFKDNEGWKEKREKINKSILKLSQRKKIKIYPFKFVWNDFNRNGLNRYLGVKWQRRETDAEYKFPSPKFVKLLDKLREMNMPIVFEDEPKNIIRFIDGWAQGINVIVPHLGFGGKSYDDLKGAKIWEKENIYTDTSYVSDVDISGEIIKKHIEEYGHEKIFFGSDYPFSHPKEELEKIQKLNISDNAKEAITSKNILRLMNRVRK